MTPTKSSEVAESFPLTIHLVEFPELVVGADTRDIFVPRGEPAWWVLNPGPSWVVTRIGEHVRVPMIEYRPGAQAHPLLFALQQFTAAAGTVPSHMYSDLRAHKPQLHVYVLMGEAGLVEPLKMGIGITLA